MAAAIIAAITDLLGVLLGGGLRAQQAQRARALEAESVLSAVCAEVEAINRLANHRQFLTGFRHHREANAALVAQGRGNGPGLWLTLELTQNYFATYEALLPKLGLLDPYFVDRITRFYTYAKAVTENYRPGSIWQTNTTAATAVAALDNDIMLLHTMHILGEHITTFRTAEPPAGVINPFATMEARDPSIAPTSEIGSTQAA